MKLYTVQGLAHWQASKVQGVLSGGIALHHVEPEWRTAYNWMRQQMKDKLPYTSGDYPVWAWPWGDYERFKPDERWGAVGEKMVVVGFEVPDERVLLSDFMAWHQVLNNDGIIDHDEEFSENEKIASWQRIFNPADLKGWSDGTPQACVDRVFPSEVFVERPFVVEPFVDDDL